MRRDYTVFYMSLSGAWFGSINEMKWGEHGAALFRVSTKYNALQYNTIQLLYVPITYKCAAPAHYKLIKFGPYWKLNLNKISEVKLNISCNYYAIVSIRCGVYFRLLSAQAQQFEISGRLASDNLSSITADDANMWEMCWYRLSVGTENADIIPKMQMGISDFWVFPPFWIHVYSIVEKLTNKLRTSIDPTDSNGPTEAN